MDKLLAEQPERQVGPKRKNDSGDRGRSYAPSNPVGPSLKITFGDRNRSFAPSNSGPPKKPNLSEILACVTAAVSPSPPEAADMLYHLGNAVSREARGRQLHGAEQTRVAAALAKLSDLLLEEQGSSKRIEQLGGKHLSLSPWGMGKLGSNGVQVSQRMGDAFAECALACPSMDGPEAKSKGWLNWANLMYGLAQADMVCSGSKHVHAAFDAAVNDRLPAERQKSSGQSVSNTFHATASAGYDGDLQPLVFAAAKGLRRLMAGATAQAWSNTIWALAKHEEMKAGRLGQGMFVILEEGVAAMLDLVQTGNVAPQALSNVLWALPKLGWKSEMSVVGVLASALAVRAADANPQHLANALWALAKLEWKGDLRVVCGLASGFIKKASSASPQGLANSLWALSELGWYVASTYSMLMSALVQKGGSTDPQHFSSAFLACAEAQHWDRNVELMSELISKQSVQQLGQWEAQHVANALYSWAVLTAVGAAPASPSFVSMAQQLFSYAASMEVAAFNDLELRQLSMAHQVAVREGLPGGGLSAHQVLLPACARSYEAQQLGLQKQIRRTAFLEQEVAAALQHAGYDVEKAFIVGSEFVQLQARGVAVTVAAADDYFRAPPSLLPGSNAIHDVLASWVCKGSVIISEAEWADLQGDPQRQQAFVAQRMQQALSKAL
ncbi:hypothetical protein DUNSADRAFT_10611 [Dunaliella salina]|uniref:RAP domain-containing protein n=1 Tax=Dunaliella salina TaxID=3046 RepID=A0ABQ7GEX7_DUNSA|nr:hypothetical protein DUNSADRAFT_10611 [Dunaliella salina]|eukprot:KAF5833161.1 hypothetical protein DUNSADRAFT_10611 [Dunaliella salina]